MRSPYEEPLWIRGEYGYLAKSKVTTPHVIGRLDCEMGRWEGGFMPRIKGAWLG
jgi:hypothetical protein